MARATRAGSARLRIHVENDGSHAEVYHITPALLGKRIRRIPGLARRIDISYGQDPARLDAALADAEILVVGSFDATGIAHRAPLLRWIQSTNAGVERLAPTLPESMVLTNRRFGLRVIGVSRSGKSSRLVDRMVRPAALKQVLPQADFVVATLPLTRETRGLIGRAELDLLPRHAGLVNLGRGAVIDNDALADKLRSGELSGAVLDVFPAEPLPAASPLWTTPNLIISPHCAVDDSTAYAERALDIFLDNLQRYLAGRRLVNVVDKPLGY